jgi:hypothetical protein
VNGLKDFEKGFAVTLIEDTTPNMPSPRVLLSQRRHSFSATLPLSLGLEEQVSATQEVSQQYFDFRIGKVGAVGDGEPALRLDGPVNGSVSDTNCAMAVASLPVASDI